MISSLAGTTAETSSALSDESDPTIETVEENG
jgi:hypothetical protein